MYPTVRHPARHLPALRPGQRALLTSRAVRLGGFRDHSSQRFFSEIGLSVQWQKRLNDLCMPGKMTITPETIEILCQAKRGASADKELIRSWRALFNLAWKGVLAETKRAFSRVSTRNAFQAKVSKLSRQRVSPGGVSYKVSLLKRSFRLF